MVYKKNTTKQSGYSLAEKSINPILKVGHQPVTADSAGHIPRWHVRFLKNQTKQVFVMFMLLPQQLVAENQSPSYLKQIKKTNS